MAHIDAEVEAKALRRLSEARQLGERAEGHANAKVSKTAPTELASRGPELEGPGRGRSRIYRTQPSGQVGGTPGGRPTNIPRNANEEPRRSLERENEAAQTLADRGYNVEQNPPPKPNGKRPDYTVEGEHFDCYSPKDNKSPYGIWSHPKNNKLAEDQADRFVLNLDDWTGDTAALRQQFADHGMPGLHEVIGVKDGSIIHIYP